MNILFEIYGKLIVAGRENGTKWHKAENCLLENVLKRQVVQGNVELYSFDDEYDDGDDGKIDGCSVCGGGI